LKGKIIVTGALGFIGRHIIENCFKDYELLALDINEPQELYKNENSDIHFFKVDLGNPHSIQKFWKEIEHLYEDIEAIIHLAAYYDFSNRPHPNYLKLQQGLQTLLNLMERDLSRNCVFISSSSMASMKSTTPGVLITEESQRSLAWEYPKSKIFNEAIIDNFKTNKTRIHLILAAVYSDFCELVPLYQSIELLKRNSLKSFFFPGHFRRGLTYVHLSDVGEAFEKALFFSKNIEPKDLSKEKDRRVYRFLIGEDRAFTYEDIHRKVTLHFNKKVKFLFRVPKILAFIGYCLLWPFGLFKKGDNFIKLWMIPFSGEHFEFSLNLSEKELHWSPKKLIHEEFPKILHNAKNNEKEWHRINKKRPWKRDQQ
jgi:nucleoside-diphosphate-sugar epimerase